MVVYTYSWRLFNNTSKKLNIFEKKLAIFSFVKTGIFNPFLDTAKV